MTLIELHPSPVDTDPDVAHKFAGAFGSLDGFVYEHVSVLSEHVAVGRADRCVWVDARVVL